MIISNNINDIRAAGEAWLRAKLEQDELQLADYPRPLKVIQRKTIGYFRGQINKHGFWKALYREIRP